MAIEKVLNTRIQLKYDSYANWEAKNPELKSGEVAIAYLASAHTTTSPDNGTHPVMFKVGPGKFNSLPWASALAADVYAWAKKSEADFTAWVKTLIDITDIDAYSKDEINNLLTTNSTNDQKYAKDLVDALAAGAVKTNADAITGIKNSTAFESFADVEAMAQEIYDGIGDPLTLTTTAKVVVPAINEVAGEVDDLAGKLNTLIGSDVNKSARTIANEELAKQLIAEGADESLNTLAEIAAWIQEHPDDAAAMNQAITALQSQLSGIAAGEGTVKKYVDDAIAALNVGQYALAADLTALAGRVQELEEAKVKYGDIVTHNVAEFATAAQGAKADSALQEITTTANGGLKVTNKNQIDIDPDVIFVFNCGSASEVI